MNKKGFGQQLSQLDFLALKKGKHHGFDATYQLYADHICSLAMHIVKNEQTALDIMQTVFEILLIKSSSLDDVCTLGAWLKQCTLNACMGYFRKFKKEFSLPAQYSETTIPSTQECEAVTNFDCETKASILLNKLSLLQRSIVYFYSVNGLKHGEIAANLDIDEAYSRKIYSRSLKQLKSWLNKSGYIND
jgi:RNA polymerase sigma factor (sigma-70 family)